MRIHPFHDSEPAASATMTRVLFVSAWEPKSGLRTAYANIARMLRPNGYRFSAYAFDAWSPDSSWGEFCDELIGPEDGTLTEVVLARRPDVVSVVDGAFSPPYGVDTWLERARYRGGVLFAAHQTQDILTEKPRTPNVFVAVSEAARETLSSRVSKPIRLVPNGVDIELFTPATDPTSGPPSYLWVGRSLDMDNKRPHAFLNLATRHKDAEFYLIDVEVNGEIQRAAAKLANMTYAARLTPVELASLYQRAAASGGALILTSRHEASPYVCLEAAACGCPLVVPTIGGTRHFQDAVTAVKYDDTDGLDAALDKALDQLSDPLLRSAIAEEARRMVLSDYTLTAMGEAYDQAYQDAARLAEGTAKRTDPVVGLTWAALLRLRRFLRAMRTHSAPT